MQELLLVSLILPVTLVPVLALLLARHPTEKQKREVTQQIGRTNDRWINIHNAGEGVVILGCGTLVRSGMLFGVATS